MCDVSFDEWAGCWVERPVKARKQHRCDCCHGTIHPGDVYTRHFSVTDGDAVSEKACPDCTAMRDAFHEAHSAIGCPSIMTELLQDCVEAEDWSGGDREAAARWQAELDAMEARREVARKDAA